MGLASIDKLTIAGAELWRVWTGMDVLETRNAHCTDPSITGAWQDSLLKLTVGVREPRQAFVAMNYGGFFPSSVRT